MKERSVYTVSDWLVLVAFVGWVHVYMISDYWFELGSEYQG